MTRTLVMAVAAFGVSGLLALPADAQSRREAQSRGRTANQPTVRHAVPRGRAPRAARPPVVRVAPNRYRGVRPYYYGYPPGVSLSFGYGWGIPYGAFGFGYGVPRAYPAYGYVVPVGPGYGGVRIQMDQRDAQVFVDGYFVGIVDDFDGTFQQLNLEPGAHRIEIRAPGLATSQFEVNILPGQKITYRTPLQPQP